MSTSNEAVWGGIGGFITGLATADLIIPPVMGVASAGLATLSLLPYALAVLPMWKIGRQINATYAPTESSGKALCSYFLLTASSLILAEVTRTAIMAAFIATLNPFTLPVMIAAGASAAVLLGLYLLTKPGPSMVDSAKDRFFNRSKPTSYSSTRTFAANTEEVLVPSSHNAHPKVVTIEAGDQTTRVPVSVMRPGQ
ncbi:MAG: hypothetical protein H0U75_10625 [Legionella sp.]|nr:hypothetical protein [Legionella sp.]